MTNKKNESIYKSYRLSALNSFFKIIPSIFVPIILARLLTPEIFGLVAISSVYVGLAQFITTFETGESIIKHEINYSFLHSIFWLNLFLGFFAYLLLFVFSEIFPFISNDNLLKKIIKIQAIVLIINSLTNVPLALLKKKLDFYSISIASLISGILSSTISIILAFLGYGVWALVSFSLINAIINFFIIFFKSNYFPNFIFNSNKIKNIFSFSLNLTLVKIMSYVERNIAKIIVGQNLGLSQVGIYSLGSTMIVKPIKSVSQFVNPVFYSLVSKKKENISENLSSNFLTYIQIVILLFYPAGIILFFFSECIIHLLLGAKWMELIPIVSIFSFLFFIRPIIKIIPEIIKKLSLTNFLLKIYMFFTPVYILAIFLSAQFGLKEVAISYVLVNFIFGIIYIYYIIKKINLSFFKIFKNIKNALINNILLAIYYCIFLYFDFYNLDVISWYFQLMILISGAFIYLLLQFIFPTHAFNYFFQFLMLNKLHISINNFLNRFFKFKNNLK